MEEGAKRRRRRTLRKKKTVEIGVFNGEVDGGDGKVAV
jgi:hypothetical protein